MIPRPLPALRQFEGPMTSELVLRPGSFGLGLVPDRLAPASTTTSICGFCATGCRLRIHLNPDGTALNVTPDADYPVNLGMACPKGWEALTPLAASDRATRPLLRAQPGGTLEPVDWEAAARTFVERMRGVQQRHGKHSVAFLSTGQIATEEMAFLGAFFKFGMGGLHCDSNTRQCMATAHVAYKQSFGFDAPPYTYRDFEESDVLVFCGSNPAIAHPIMWQRVQRNPHKPTILVIDPRRTETAQAATQHLAVRPRGDLWLLTGIQRELLALGAIDRGFIERHTNGFAEFEAHLQAYTVEQCADRAGVSIEQLRQAAQAIARGRAVSLWWTMGVNQGHESTRTAQALINIALMTGNIGRPGTGANSITGQCNAMGSRIFGNTTSLFAGRSFQDAAHRAEVARILGISEATIPWENSWAYDQIIDGIESGAIRGLWVIATNPLHSWIDSGRLARLREKLEFLVVQDMYSSTETAVEADLLLPAAGWGEKDGTFINSERRIGVIRRVARAPGQALADFSIFRLLAQAWGCGPMFANWSTPEEVFRLLAKLSDGRPCDITGLGSYEQIDRLGGVQWPCTSEDAHRLQTSGAPPLEKPRLDRSRLPYSNERRLFADGHFFTSDRRARFHFDAPKPAPEEPDAHFPFWLNTGRGSSAQWHTGTRTSKSAVLNKLAPVELWCELHPEDAFACGIEAGSHITIESRRGTVEAVAVLSTVARRGQVFLPMHFDGVNNLTFPAFDTHSRQPSYKACAVRLRKV